MTREVVVQRIADISVRFRGAKKILSASDLPQSISGGGSHAAHWCFEMGNDLKNELLGIINVWAQGGNMPYEYSQENMPWFIWTFDFYVPQPGGKTIRG